MPVPVIVRFEPSGIAVSVVPGTTVLEAARLIGLNIASPCSGRGTCGKCAVRIIDGTPGAVRPVESHAEMPPGVLRACILEVGGPLRVRPLNVASESLS